MMTPEEKYELFERKISNQLSAEEERALLKSIAEDATLAEEFKLYQELNSHVDVTLNNEKEQADLEHTLQHIGDTFFDNKTTKKESKVIKMPSWVYAAAASVALIFGVYFFNQSGPSYKDFASIPALSITERGNEEELIKQAETAFNSKEYKKASIYLSKLLQKDTANSEYQFYYGISLMEQEKYTETTTVFTKLRQGNSAYKYKAIWFEALNQLKQEEFDRCLQLLKTLPEEAEDYQQAQKLLKKL